MSTLWLLVGRGGSRGVPGKNLKRINGITLIEWKIRAACAADDNPQIVCSSDSSAILQEAKACGVPVTIPRPPELATDTATTASVVSHALRVTGFSGERICLLEPSAPFTTGDEYRRAQQMMTDLDADLIVGMKPSEPHSAFIGDVREDKSVTPIILGFQRMARRRQDFAPQWTMSGGCYLFKREMFEKTQDIYGGSRNYGLIQTKHTGHEIDTQYDLEIAEWFSASGLVVPG